VYCHAIQFFNILIMVYLIVYFFLYVVVLACTYHHLDIEKMKRIFSNLNP